MQTQNLTIMFTDIKGFTPKTSKMSREKLHKLLDQHDELILPLFKKFKGRLIKTIGDAFMVTFHSPTDAVLCGMAIQKRLEKHNDKSEVEDQLEVRIAINSGEVTFKRKDVFGEAVNIAARLEGLAEAGTIYFTESVYLAMNKSEIPTAEIGYKHFKGIPEEIKVYKVLGEKSKKMLAKKERRVIRERVTITKKILIFIKWAALILIGAAFYQSSGPGALFVVILVYLGIVWLSDRELFTWEEIKSKKTLIKILKWIGIAFLGLMILGAWQWSGLFIALLIWFIIYWFKIRKK